MCACRYLLGCGRTSTVCHSHPLHRRTNPPHRHAVVLLAPPKLRTMATGPGHYEKVLDSTEAYLSTLGVKFKYVRADSPFPVRAKRNPPVESHQRNQALDYAYAVLSNDTLAAEHGVRSCGITPQRIAAVRRDWRSATPPSVETIDLLKQCPVVFIADDDNVYLPTLFPALRKVVQVALFPTGNMGYDGIEGPIVEPTDDAAYGLGGKVVGFNVWHGSDPSNPRGWDKNGADRKFKGDMAGIAFNAVMGPRFSGPRYGYHETDIVEQTGVKDLTQIEGSMEVFAHHIHNVDHKGGRLCYPLTWDYNDSDTLWFNIKARKTYSTRAEACNGCAPDKAAKEFRGCAH